MAFQEAGKLIKTKRKAAGFKTQKSLIQALQQAAPDLNCSESYLSLIESGAKSPGVHLLDAMAEVLQLTPQEKGQLLLTYKRVPSDLEAAVRNNLKEATRFSHLELLKQQYEANPDKETFNQLILALVWEGQGQEALDRLQQAPSFSANFIELQERTAHMASISGNYDFALQAFQLALANCPAAATRSRADLLMKTGIAWFGKGLKQQYDKPLDALECFAAGRPYLEQALAAWPDNLYALDELARCLYHIADGLQYFHKNRIPLAPDPQQQPSLATWLGPKPASLEPLITAAFTQALAAYRRILCHPRQRDIPEKALKEAVYFHAYTQAKLGRHEEALLLLNSAEILERNWLVYFMKAGLALMGYEAEPRPEWLAESLACLRTALEYDPETVTHLVNIEKNRELKTLWEQNGPQLTQYIQESIP